MNVHLELAKISDSYARFVPRQFLEQLGKERITDVVLGDQVQRVMTVLFADIRDFTRLAEKMTPAETFQFVNQYLGAMEPAITRHNGVIDKYVGDAVMALFPDQPDDALQAALEMFRRLEAFNSEREPTRRATGSDRHRHPHGYADAWNRRRARTHGYDGHFRRGQPRIPCREPHQDLSGAADRHRRYLSAPCNRPTALAMRRIDRVLVQGKSQPVVLYEVLDADTPERRAAKQESQAEFEAGLSCYDAWISPRAIDCFERALAVLPSDTVAQVLIERARRFAREPSVAAQQVAARVDKA